ncbi:dihydroneopterin aldolase family protein [Methanolobus mangrovi]|uniref:Dihydroneopterin aldolase n=1 Tax=Methanolobus mangrovi TaxID=3072977 RepID=A0AA51UFC8_9EURY|nr:dihydroneopterin aldolase family protein [Methanolobus mangrovi]WMW22138.1 dihydroneopterin aldolase family protein [Methanolobus mangrovi]
MREIMQQNEVITDRDNVLFEAGIKLGALYHQFTGSPVNLKTVDSLEKAIQESISVQPCVEDITVSINRDMIRSKLNSEYGYCELEGRMLDVSITASFKSAKVDVSLAFDTELDYPLMKIENIY